MSGEESCSRESVFYSLQNISSLPRCYCAFMITFFIVSAIQTEESWKLNFYWTTVSHGDTELCEMRNAIVVLLLDYSHC